MSTFIVDVRKIEKIWPHTNADRLELGKVEGLDFQFVMQKDLNKEGDTVVYFPVDSLLPKEFIEKMEINYLAGPEQNRIKTAKLRSEISQGMIININSLIEHGFLTNDVKVGDDVTELLGVTKYDPEPNFTPNGILYPLPSHLSKYDIEGFERFPQVVGMLMDMNVEVTEKLEGSNCSFSFGRNGELFICQRENYIVEKEDCENLIWKLFRDLNIEKEVRKVFAIYPDIYWITMYGELLGPGVLGNHYKLKNSEIRFFDVKFDYKWLNPDCNLEFSLINLQNKEVMAFGDFIKFIGLSLRNNCAPTTHYATDGTLKDFLNGKTLTEMSNGKSILNPSVRREGIVIRPAVEQNVELLGRLILKKRSPEYLANSDL